ncbi:peptide/nickel transport system permease protein [Rossellomorea marisflavi]
MMWRKNGGAILSGLFLLLLVLASIGNTFWNDGDVSQTVLLKGEDGIISAPPFPPSKEFLLGTDEKGYDLLGRAIEGAKWSIGITILIAFLRIFFAFWIGMVMTYVPSWLYARLEALFDSFSILPLTMVAFVILESVLLVSSGTTPTPFYKRAGFEVLILVILVLPPLSFYMAKETKRIKEREFMDAARVLGGSERHQIWSHIIPHLLPVSGVMFIQQFVQTLIIFLHLGVLGLFFGGTMVFMGPNGPEIESISQEWSGLIGANFRYIVSHPWIPLAPIGFYTVTIIAAQTLLKRIEGKTGKRSSL